MCKNTACIEHFKKKFAAAWKVGLVITVVDWVGYSL